MSKFVIAFRLTSKSKTLPIFKVIDIKSLVCFQFIIGKKMKQNYKVEFLFENTHESPNKIDPISFELICKPDEETFVTVPLMFQIDCSKVDLQLQINPIFKDRKDVSLSFEIHCNSSDSGINSINKIPMRANKMKFVKEKNIHNKT